MVIDKKIITFILCVALCVPFTSCRNTHDEQDKATWKTLKVELFIRNENANGHSSSDNSYLTKYVQENYGNKNKINIEFFSVARNDENMAINKALATARGPDIMFTYSPYYFMSYAKNNELCDLTDYLHTHGENLKKLLSDEVLSYGKFNDRQYAIPAKRMIQGKLTSYIRKDWLDKLGLGIPENTEELIHALTRFKTEDPGKIGKENVIPLGTTGGNTLMTRTLILNFTYNAVTNVTNRFSNDKFKESLIFMNKLFHDGLLPKNYAIYNSDQLVEDIIKGNVGMFTDALSPSFKNTTNKFELLKNNVKDAEFVVCDPFTNSGNKHYKELYGTNGMYIFVPSYSKNAEEAVKYLDWMSKTETLTALQFGQENVHYKKENSKMKIIDFEKYDSDLFNSFDIAIVVNGFNASNAEESVEFESQLYGDYADLYIDSHNVSIKDGVTSTVNLLLEKELKYADSLGKKYDELLVRCIIAPVDNFEKVYADACIEYFNAGAGEIEQERANLEGVKS